MKEMNDEELQKLVEQQLKAGIDAENAHDTDEQLYSTLFRALAEPPPAEGTSRLAENVIRQIEQEESRAETMRYSLTIAAVLLFCALLMGISMLIISPAVLQLILAALNAYKWIIAFVVIAVISVEYLDGKLVRKQISQR